MTTAHTPEPRAAEPPPTAQRSMADLVRAAVSGWLGTALEFMDFQLYSLAAALVFSQLFFSGESPGMAVVLSMATYGAASGMTTGQIVVIFNASGLSLAYSSGKSMYFFGGSTISAVQS